MDIYSSLFGQIPGQSKSNFSVPIPKAYPGGRPKVIIGWKGLQIGIEAQPGDMRHNRIMQASYGHIQNFVGVDGDALDVYIGVKPASERVFQVDQLRLDNGAFDEHKFMLWYASPEEARYSYLQHAAPKMLGGIKEVSLSQLEKFRR